MTTNIEDLLGAVVDAALEERSLVDQVTQHACADAETRAVLKSIARDAGAAYERAEDALLSAWHAQEQELERLRVAHYVAGIIHSGLVPLTLENAARARVVEVTVPRAPITGAAVNGFYVRSGQGWVRCSDGGIPWHTETERLVELGGTVLAWEAP